MSACRPHDWKLPEVGDDAVVCVTCGRAISYVFELNAHMAGRIVGAYARRNRDHRGDFGHALTEAQADAIRRWKEAGMPGLNLPGGSAPDHPSVSAPRGKLRGTWEPRATTVPDHPHANAPRHRLRGTW